MNTHTDNRIADALAVVLAARRAYRTGSTADVARLIAQNDDVHSLCARLAVLITDPREHGLLDHTDDELRALIAELRA